MVRRRNVLRRPPVLPSRRRQEVVRRRVLRRCLSTLSVSMWHRLCLPRIVVSRVVILVPLEVRVVRVASRLTRLSR